MKKSVPRVVLCLGLKSSGSTWLYNVAIQVLKEASPKPKVAAFYADNFRMLPKGSDTADTLVIKTHEPTDAILYLTRFSRGRMFVTVREPRDAAASLMQRFGHSFEGVLKDLTQEGAILAELKRKVPTATFHYEDKFTDDERTVGKIARHLGVELSEAARRRIFRAHSKEAVKKKIGKVMAEDAHPDSFDPKTHWHPGHVGDGRIGKYKSVLTGAEQKKVLAATLSFRRAFGYLPRKK